MKARFSVLACGMAAAMSTAGCIVGNRPNFVSSGSERTGKTYYLDGAGNLGFGKETVPLGLAEGGYRGHVEHYIWTTYMGAVMDQVSLSHNRREGRDLAYKIERYLRYHPNREVNIVALSAGTGVAVFALEYLRPGYNVNNVVLLSSSLSADYDLSRALRRVKGGIYFFWSPSDPILRGVVPVLGTVDRADRGTQPAGALGARLPRYASSASRKLYTRVHNVPWHPKQSGNFITLHHAGSTSKDVIRDLVAPIIVKKPEPRKAIPIERPSTKANQPASTRPRSSNHSDSTKVPKTP